MATLTLVPLAWSEWIDGSAWSPNPGSGTDHLKAVDAKTLSAAPYDPSIVSYSNSLFANNFVDEATGLPVNWADKQISYIQAYGEGGWVSGPGKTYTAMNKASNQLVDFFITNNFAGMAWGSSPNEPLGGGAVVAPPTISTDWDRLRDWIRANDAGITMRVSNAAGLSHNFIYGQCKLVVTYTTISPPAAPSYPPPPEF